METGGRRRPVPHEEVIESGEKNDLAVPRIEGQRAVEAGHRFAPASLPSIDDSEVPVDLGNIRRTRSGDLELLESRIVIFVSPIEAETQSQMSFPQGWR